MLIHWTEQSKRGKIGRFSLVRLFTQPKVMALGMFTYSLYLLHAPFLAAWTILTEAVGLQGVAAYASIMFLGVPFAVAACYGFYLVFERPFLPQYVDQAPEHPLLRLIDSLTGNRLHPPRMKLTMFPECAPGPTIRSRS